MTYNFQIGLVVVMTYAFQPSCGETRPTCGNDMTFGLFVGIGLVVEIGLVVGTGPVVSLTNIKEKIRT